MGCNEYIQWESIAKQRGFNDAKQMMTEYIYKWKIGTKVHENEFSDYNKETVLYRIRKLGLTSDKVRWDIRMKEHNCSSVKELIEKVTRENSTRKKAAKALRISEAWLIELMNREGLHHLKNEKKLGNSILFFPKETVPRTNKSPCYTCEHKSESKVDKQSACYNCHKPQLWHDQVLMRQSCGKGYGYEQSDWGNR